MHICSAFEVVLQAGKWQSFWALLLLPYLHQAFDCFTVGFHTHLKELLTATNSLRLLYNKLLIVWNMHCICFVLSLRSLVTTVSPLLLIHVLMTLKGLRTRKALSEGALACTGICFCWFSYKCLDAYCLLGFNFNYLLIITWHNHNFHIVGSDKQLDCTELNTYDPVIMMSSALNKKNPAWCGNSSLKSGETGWSAKEYRHCTTRVG